MAKPIRNHHSCSRCESSDAATTYKDEDGRQFEHCYSCGATVQLSLSSDRSYTPRRQRPMQVIDLPEITLDDAHPFLAQRRLAAATLAKYGAGFTDGGATVSAPYFNDAGLPVLIKHRGRGKKFWLSGSENRDSIGLYGWHAASTRKYLLIVEGEVDAWSAHQMLGGSVSVVSVPNGVNDAAKRVLMDLEKIEKYERVTIMFDADPQGREAQEKVLEVLPGAYSASHATGFKDASDYLQAGATQAFKEAFWGAVSVAPSGFLDKGEIISRTRDFLTNPDQSIGLSFGFEGLDEMLGGQRPGEVITWAAGTGGGKSTIMRNLLWKLTTAGIKTLYLPFEDLTEAAMTQLAQLELGRNVLRLPQEERTPELMDSIGSVMERMLEHLTIVTQFQWKEADEVIKKLEYGIRRYATRVVVIDHITWLAEASQEDSRQVLERVMPALKSLSTRFGVTIHLVTHLSRDSRDKDDTEPSLSRLKNSTAIQQISDAVLGLTGKRDQNLVKVVLLKQSRLWGRGDLSEVVMRYDPTTTRLEETSVDDFASDWEEEGYSSDAPSEEDNETTQQVRERRVRRQRKSQGDDVRASESEASSTSDVQTRPAPPQRADSGDEGSPSRPQDSTQEDIPAGLWVEGATWPGFEEWGPSPYANYFPYPGPAGLDEKLGPQWVHRTDWDAPVPNRGSVTFGQAVQDAMGKALD